MIQNKTLIKDFDFNDNKNIEAVKSIAIKYAGKFFNDYHNRKDVSQKILIDMWILFNNDKFKKYEFATLKGFIFLKVKHEYLKYCDRNKIYQDVLFDTGTNEEIQEKYLVYFLKMNTFNMAEKWLEYYDYKTLLGIEDDSVFKLFLEGCSNNEIAKILKKSNFCIMNQLSKIRLRLQKEFIEYNNYLIKAGKKSKYEGVSVYYINGKQYIKAFLKINGKTISLGQFDNQDQAYQFLQEAKSKMMRGENIPIIKSISNIGKSVEVFINNEWKEFTSIQNAVNFVYRLTKIKLNKTSVAYSIRKGLPNHKGIAFRALSEKSTRTQTREIIY